MRRHTVIAALFILLGACSGESGSGTAADNNGWELNNETSGTNGTSGGENNADTNNGTAGSDNNGSGNNGSGNNGSGNNGSGNNGSNNASANNGTTQTSGSSNNSANNTNTNNTTSTSGTTNTTPGGQPDGADCTVNSDCAGELTCCAGFDGQGTCQDQCFGGGLCGGDDGECPTDMECCDLSGIGAPDSCFQQCRGGGGGNMGAPCMANAECGMGEVCCPGFDGNSTCRPESDCLSGGVCEQDGDCNNGQMCCDLSVTKVCLDQCSF